MKKISKNEKNIKNFKEPTSQSISYSGEVTISIKKGSKTTKSLTIKNYGTNLLFEGICLALIQHPNNKMFPNFIGVGKGDSTITENYKLDNEIVRVKVNRSYVEETSSGNGFHAIFASSFPWSLIGANNAIKEIGLFGTDKTDSNYDSMLARIVLPNTIEITQGINLIVEWKILIKNGD